MKTKEINVKIEKIEKMVNPKIVEEKTDRFIVRILIIKEKRLKAISNDFAGLINDIKKYNIKGKI